MLCLPLKRSPGSQTNKTGVIASAKGMVRSYVPSVVLKCQSMGFCSAAFSENVNSFMLVCLHKHYLGEWWKPQLISISDRFGLGGRARQGIHATQTDYQR